jgi:hypothetical protein
MTPDEYGRWNYCRDVSHKSGKVYLSGRAIANEFSGITKNVIYRIAENLLAAGWLQELAKPHRVTKTGLLAPRVVRALSHDEWVAKYPAAPCRARMNQEPCPENRTGVTCPENSPVLFSEPPVPFSASACPVLSASCPEFGNKSERESESKYEREGERKKNSKSEASPTLTSSTENEQDLGQIEAAVQEMQQWMLGLDPALKFMPASKDGEHDATKAIIGRRLREGVTARDIKTAVGRVPLDNDPNPSFTIRDNLDAAINQVLKDREAAAVQANFLRAVEARERKKAVAELEEADRKQAEEQALIEDHLGL